MTTHDSTTHDTTTIIIDTVVSADPAGAVPPAGGAGLDPAEREAVVDAYLAAWNARDAGARAGLCARALGADLWYRDPLLTIDGRDAFVATLGAVQEQFPGHVMIRTSAIDGHHDVVRFTWAFGEPGEAPALAGVDVAKFDAAGRLHRIIGFAPAGL